MKYAIMSDIHSNLEALKATLKDVQSFKPDKILCLGDVVGYGAQPAEALELTRKAVEDSGGVCLAGNHDHAVVEMTDVTYFNAYAVAAVDYARAHLGQEALKYLAALPLVKEMGDFVLAHASLEIPERWDYIMNTSSAQPSLRKLKSSMLFIGHTHLPGVCREEKKWESVSEGRVELIPGEKIVVNVGSVGQPRDGRHEACWVLFDDKIGELYFRRVNYNVQKTQEKILKAGLPDVLAKRLSLGR
ncbi:MAG: metallophosphoesterase [Candidatus Omnitrophica bacterium]|nr:metallophosphoesterase [Candidatus Omnitrophota bacterium]